MSKKIILRGIRKTAFVAKRVTTKASTVSGRVEDKATRMIHGTDPTIKIYGKALQEEITGNALPEITPIHPALPLPGRKPVINLLLPSLQSSSFFGGTATALIFAAKLATEKKMPLRVVETLVHGNAKAFKLQVFLKEAGFPMKVEDITILNLAGRKYNHYGYIDLHPDDIFVASAWWDAHILNTLPLQNKYIYLVQDFEPCFYNNSDQYVLAEDTYRNKSFIPVFNTKLMMEFMQKKGYSGIQSEDTLYFEPAVNIGRKIGYSELKKPGDKRQLFIYGRPSVHRNLFYRALEVVNKAFAEGILDGNEWEVSMAGQDKLPNILLDCGVTVNNLGKMDLDKYYEFAKTIDIGVSLMMAPHPSYPPLELSSLGVSVVTTKYEDKQDLSFYSKNIIVCDSSLSSLVEGVRKASLISTQKRIENASASTLLSNWDEALNDVVKAILKK